jgi:DNA-binding NarL/FixJ family response regulator
LAVWLVAAQRGITLSLAHYFRDRDNGGGDVMSDSAGTAKLRVLVAEDDTVTRLDVCQILEQNDFSVCGAARDGIEALQLARTAQPDVVILDIGMPEIDGVEVARRILAERTVPIVMLTGDGRQEMMAEAIAAGVYAYLVKPFRQADLVPAIMAAQARNIDLRAGTKLGSVDDEPEIYLSGYGYTA